MKNDSHYSNMTLFVVHNEFTTQLHSNVRFMGRSVVFVNSVDLLGVPLYADLKVNHIHSIVQKIYCKVNSL